MTTQPISSIPADVADFVAQVRAASADLPPDEVDELTAGLAADLADARAESPDSWREGVGSPAAYAAELRAAAGLPARAAGAPASEPSAFDRAVEAWRASSLQPAVRRWYDELRPGGWVLRGFIATWLLFGFVGGRSLLSTAVLSIPLAALSVWIGLEARKGRPWARVVGGFGVVLAVLFGVAIAGNHQTSEPAGSYDHYVSPDLNNGGDPIQNLYGFDAAGHRIDGLRVFDQDGRPIRTYDFNGVEIGAFPGVTDPGLQADPWAGVPDRAWVPPLTIPPAALSPGATVSSTTSSTSSSDPATSTSESSSSSTSRSDDDEQQSPSPRATSTSR